MISMRPDKEAFNRLYADYELGLANLEQGYRYSLTVRDVVDILGWPAAELFFIFVTTTDGQFKEITILLEDIRSLLKERNARQGH